MEPYVTQDKAGSAENGSQPQHQTAPPSTYYSLLGLKPSASVREIRQAYRDLSKLYHPDTTQLSAAIATAKFQQLNEAYATLSNVERRTAYDQKIGYSRVVVSQPLPSLNRPRPKYSSSAYLDPTARPLSPGELFALFILGITFVGCLILALAIGLTRGDDALQAVNAKKSLSEIIEAITSDSPKSKSITSDSPKSSEEILPPAAPAPAIKAFAPPIAPVPEAQTHAPTEHPIEPSSQSLEAHPTPASPTPLLPVSPTF